MWGSAASIYLAYIATGGSPEISLHSGDPTPDGSANELEGGGYSRTDCYFSFDYGVDPKTHDMSGATFENNNEIVFEEGTDDLGLVTHFVIHKNGTPFIHGEFTEQVEWLEGKVLRIPIGALKFKLSVE